MHGLSVEAQDPLRIRCHRHQVLNLAAGGLLVLIARDHDVAVLHGRDPGGVLHRGAAGQHAGARDEDLRLCRVQKFLPVRIQRHRLDLIGPEQGLSLLGLSCEVSLQELRITLVHPADLAHHAVGIDPDLRDGALCHAAL